MTGQPATSEANTCDYCNSILTHLGKQGGISAADMLDGRQAASSDLRTDAALKFASAVLDTRGKVGDDDRLATQLAGLKRVWEQDRRAVDAIVGDSKRGKNAVAAQTLDQAVRADAEAEALALATATEKERTNVRAEMKEKQVKEAGELERKIEEAKIEKLRATGVKGSG